MKKILVILLFLYVNVHAQPMFRHTYGFGIVNEGKCVVQTMDHGYAIAGSTTPGWGNQNDAYLIKTDSLANPLFQYSYGTAGIDQANAILELPDSGFILAGFTNGFSVSNDYDILLIRTDKNGIEQWKKSFGTTDWDFVYDMQFTTDGNIVLTGNSYGSGNGISAGYVAKADLNGNLLWQKFDSKNEEVIFNRIAVGSDGRLTTCGELKNTSTNSSDGYVRFMDANGDSTRTSTIDFNNKNESLGAIGYFSNLDIAVGGTSEDTGNHDDLMARIDTSGNITWIGVVNKMGEEFTYDILVQNDTLTFAGTTSTDGGGKKDFHIFRFDTLGVFFAPANTYGGSEDDICYGLISTNDGGWVLVGSSRSYGPGTQSVLLIKTDSDFTYNPNVTISVNEIDKQSINIYPNPSSKQFHISAYKISEAKITIRDISGRIILQRQTLFPADIEIENPGIYFIELSGENFYRSSKLIVTN
jgi:hypothetical protein